MKNLVALNNPVTLSFIEALLKDSKINYLILDQNMSTMEGSIGIIPRRIMVANNQIKAACILLENAGLEKELLTSSKNPEMPT